MLLQNEKDTDTPIKILIICAQTLPQCTVLEVKVIEGHGTTIDVVLANGMLHEGDQIVVCGMQVCILSFISILVPLGEVTHENLGGFSGVGANCYLNQSIANTTPHEGAQSQGETSYSIITRIIGLLFWAKLLFLLPKLSICAWKCSYS